jgi:glucan phosphoethanolaminetransferase (alkaline phosphatase superfamily)
MIEEIFVLWLALSIALGGFGIQSTQIGLLLFACAPVPLVSQILVFPRLVNYIGFKSVFNSSMLIMGITFALIPFSNNLLGLSSVYPAWTYLAVTFTFFLVGRFFGFASVYALINNSCDRHRGSVNGIGQSVASLARIIAPIIGGAMYSFSVSKAENRDSIIDVRLIFFFLAAWCSCTAFLGLSLPDSINRKGSENAKSSAAEQMKDPSISIKESS